MSDTIAPLQEVDQRFLKALENKDLEGMMACYWNSPDLVYFSIDVPVLQGWEIVRAQWGQFLALADLKQIRLLDPQYEISENLGMMRGMLQGTLIPHGGSPLELTIRMTRIFGRRDGIWVYIMDHVSIPQS